MACKCYHAERNFIGKIGVCWGTKECEACSCGGDEAKCDFYDYVRERAKILSQKPTNADRLRAMTDEELAEWINDVTTNALSVLALGSNKQTKTALHWLDWLRQEAQK